MCGIVGQFNFVTSTPVLESELSRALAKMAHRGPDQSNQKTYGHLGLAMNRLSIIGIDSAGCGPLRSRSGRYSIIFNGEVFNYKELKKQYGTNYPYQTSTDTEVVLSLYDGGVASPEVLLRGMYAFAVYDHQLEELTLVRDRMGEKPLFYCFNSHGILFASEIKAFQSFSEFRARPSRDAIVDFLALGYVSSDRAAFEGVNAVPAGAKITISKKNGTRIEKYWNIPCWPESEKKPLSEGEASELLEYHFDEAVRYRTVADVPMSLFLSSGIDSSTLLAYASRHTQHLKAFTIGFDSQYRGEGTNAKMIADCFGVDHEEILLTADDISSDFSRVVEVSDNLLANPAMFANFKLSKTAGPHYKVALNGGGGDELFYGYPTYQADWLKSHFFKNEFFKNVLMKTSFLGGWLPLGSGGVGPRYKFNKFLEGMNYDARKAHYWWRTILTDGDQSKIWGRDWALGEIAKPSLELASNEFPIDPMEKFLLMDLQIWWRHMGLYQGDIISMANSLELRIPMMDHKFIEFAVSLPQNLKFSPYKTKPLLRTFAARSLPSKVTKMKKKGFYVPLDEWFRGSLCDFVRDKLSEDRLMPLGCDQAAIRGLLEEHLNGSQDNSYKLLNLMVLGEWYHHYFGNQPLRHFIG